MQSSPSPRMQDVVEVLEIEQFAASLERRLGVGLLRKEYAHNITGMDYCATAP